MKYLKIGIYELAALAIITIAALFRLALMAQGWPLVNSDEATIGIMARHIAYNGEHPIFFYGQNYMGVLEAYLGAALFHLFGSSLFTLRLGLLILFILFLLSTYLLTSLLYSKSLALVTIAWLSIGSSYVVGRELSAIGGYPETLLFGSLAFLCASWLVISYRPGTALHKQGWRFVAYAGWGLAVGLGLWSDLLVLPFVLISGFLILLFCWRELLRLLAILCILLGFVIGAYPLISYNLTAAPGEDSFTKLWLLQHGGSSHITYTTAILTKELTGTIQVSIPMMTGNPFCPVSELSFLGPTSPHTLQCTLAHTSWGLGYLLLFAISLIATLWLLGKSLLRRGGHNGYFLAACLSRAHSLHSAEAKPRCASIVAECLSRSTQCVGRLSRELHPDKTLPFAQYTARLMLLASAFLALSLYALSAAPIDWPGIHARYLIGLLIATPALLWPLWSGVQKGIHRLMETLLVSVGAGVADDEGRGPLGRPIQGEHKKQIPFILDRTTQEPPPFHSATPAPTITIGVFSAIVLASISLISLLGAGMIFGELPAAQTANQQQQHLISHLISIGATHIYTDYWTCDSIAFMSNERIICGVVDGNLQPSHNRDVQYYTIVSSDPHSAYVFPLGSSQLAAARKKAEGNKNTQRTPAGAKQPYQHYQSFSFDGYMIYLPG